MPRDERETLPEAWFLGPKAENAALLRELIGQAVERHVLFRQEAYPRDPSHFPPGFEQDSRYIAATAELRQATTELLAALAKSIPFASMRYQGHMNWDQALPALVGYVAALLYNQNNVAAEASPVTTELEMQVGDDLCRMVGFTPEPRPRSGPASAGQDGQRGGHYAWAHLTADGSVANIEALWAARNAKFLPLALAVALRGSKAGDALHTARGLTVRLGDGRDEPLIGLDAWEALNLPLDEALALLPRLAKECGIAREDADAAVMPHTVQHLGLLEFYRRSVPGCGAGGSDGAGTVGLPRVLAPATRHYSWPKAATLLGLGAEALLAVAVDDDGRMSLDDLERKLEECRKVRQPVVAVVAVLGTTEEGAVDPLLGVLRLRDKFRSPPVARDGSLGFAVHVDAAWGGYFASMLNAPGVPFPLLRIPDTPRYPLNDHTRSQYAELPKADSVTVDPHKAGYVPYPAGALCYRDKAMRDLVSLRSPVVHHADAEPTVGVFGVEGSRPGAAAAAVWLAHRVIRPDRDGYGKVLGHCMWASKRWYCRLATIEEAAPDLVAVPLQRLPRGRGRWAGGPKAVRKLIREEIVKRDDAKLEAALEADPELAEVFRAAGSDQLIVAFALNFRIDGGEPNPDHERANRFNKRVFELCSATTPRCPMPDLFLTGSEFDPCVRGQGFVDRFCHRMGVHPVPKAPLNFLISTTMGPWLTSTGGHDMLDDLEAALIAAAQLAKAEAVA